MTYPCDRCDGMGEIYVHERLSPHAYLTKWQPCPDCDDPTAAPTWVGTVLESCIRDVALGRIASHSSVTDEMVAEWRRLNPGRAAR